MAEFAPAWVRFLGMLGVSPGYFGNIGLLDVVVFHILGPVLGR